MKEFNIYISNPVEVIAVEWDGSIELFDQLKRLNPKIELIFKDCLKITTLEGQLIANVGDFILQNKHGDTYTYKTEVFNKNFQRVT